MPNQLNLEFILAMDDHDAAYNRACSWNGARVRDHFAAYCGCFFE